MKYHYQSVRVRLATILLATLTLLTPSVATAQILVSIEPYRELAERLAPDLEVDVLLPPGATPHAYDPTPRDVARLVDAQWIIMNGGGVDGFILDLIEAARSDAFTFVAFDALETTTLLIGTDADHAHGTEAHEHGDETHDHAEETHDHANETHEHADEGHGEADETHEHGDETHDHAEETHDHANETHEHADELHDHDHSGPNGHVWLDPKRMIMITNALADALAEQNPDEADSIRARAATYVAELEALDAEIAELLAPYEGAPFIPFHDAWPYFADRYQLDLIMEIEPFPGREPTARQLATAIAVIKEHGATGIFSEAQLPSRPAEVLAAEAGVALGILDPVGGSEGRPTYRDLLRYNARVIAATLTPTRP